MADKNIYIKDGNGNKLYPVTKASLVISDTGADLSQVEAGAQVNKIEKIKVNGVELAIVSKEVDITVPSVPEYSLVKATVADANYSATYQLTKDGAPIGDKINIAKDLVVQSGMVVTVTEDDAPVEGYQVGDKYIDLLLANSNDEHIYILVSDLIDIYRAGNGILVSDNTISVDTLKVAMKGESYTKEEADGKFAVATNVYSKTEADTKFLTEHQSLAEYAKSATTLAGYGITDALSYEEIAEN